MMEVLAAVQFVGDNGESVIIPWVKVTVGPGPDDCDLTLSPILEAAIINLLEKKGKDYEAKKKAHYDKYGWNRDHMTFHTVKIEDMIVSRKGWSTVRTALVDDYVQGGVG